MSVATAVRAPRGSSITCKGWHQEAALRMIHNNLDPEVAENPDELIVYGGRGRAARDWPSFHAIVRSLQSLENDETLIVQSGKPVGMFRTHPEAPRVLIANSNLVGHWSNFDEFTRLGKHGPHDVRPDDRRLVDLHRQPGHRARHVRNIRRRWRANISADRSRASWSSRAAWAAWAARSLWPPP